MKSKQIKTGSAVLFDQKLIISKTRIESYIIIRKLFIERSSNSLPGKCIKMYYFNELSIFLLSMNRVLTSAPVSLSHPPNPNYWKQFIVQYV